MLIKDHPFYFDDALSCLNLSFVNKMKSLTRFRRTRPFQFWVSASACLSLGLNGLLNLLIDWFAVSPYGHGAGFLFLVPAYVLGPLILLALLGVPVSVIAIPFRRTRKTATIVLLSCVIYLVGSLSLRLGAAVRWAGFERQALRGTELVHAINRFESKYAHPPPTLEALVPEFLAVVPSTGMPAYPDWRYVLGEDARERYSGNPWVLYMDCSSGFINFDMFLYFPNQNYPESGYGGWLERIGNWAYVHE